VVTNGSGPDDGGGAATRRGRLLAIKLRALVRDHLSDQGVAEPEPFAPGAALLHGDVAWVLLDDRPETRLGAALAWSIRHGAAGLQVITESASGVLARRATEFEYPVSVWHADERTLWPAVPEPFTVAPSLTVEHAAFKATIEAAGADPVEEYGVLTGELRGLEVCRVVDDPFTGSARLEVGIGAHDREAFSMLHGEIPTADSLARVVAAVAEHRSLDAPPHPFNRIARERLLRWMVTTRPEAIGAVAMEPIAPPLPRVDLKDIVPCVAAGRDADDRTVVAVCSAGVDLDVIPYAADARMMVANATSQPEASLRLVVAAPARDLVALTRELAGLLREPCDLVAL
jgi:hypothetical protein